MKRSARYAPHTGFVAPAEQGRALWRLVFGFMLATAGYVALTRLFIETVFSATAETNPNFAIEIFEGQTPLAMLLLLSTFVFMALPLAVILPTLHKRGFLSLVGPLPLAVSQFVRVFVPLVVLGGALMLLPPYDMGGPLVPNLPPVVWASLLPLSLIAVFVQISAEELVFRGYVQQQLAARFASPLVWMVLPSVLFALGHYNPEEAGSNAWFLVIWAGIFGMLMADITARSGSLGPAIALHFYNNVTAILIISVPDSLGGLALFHAPFGLADEAVVRAWLPVDFAHIFVAWLVTRLALRR